MNSPIKLNPVELEILAYIEDLPDDDFPMEGPDFYERVRSALPHLTKGQILQSLNNMAEMAIIDWSDNLPPSPPNDPNPPTDPQP